MRGLALLVLALCGLAEAGAQPRIELSLAPAWDGWSRPGRTTEVEIQLRSGAAAQAILQVSAGRETVHAPLDLEAGRTQRLHVAVGSAERVTATLTIDGQLRERREIGIAQSESPLLGIAAAPDVVVGLDGFNAVRLQPDDLPHDASAYSSVDALALDATALGALDQRQLGALISHAAECGRIALIDPDPGVRGILAAAAGCGGAMLVSAATGEDAAARLEATLAVPPTPPAALSGLRELAPPRLDAWQRVVLVVAAYLGAAALAATFSSSAWVIASLPALATLVAYGVLQLSQSTTHLLVWAEAAPTARVAQYQAWQRISAPARGRARVPVLTQLGSVRPCSGGELRLEFDAALGRAVSAEIEARLFQPITLCYSGSFPVMRAVAIDTGADDALRVRNAGSLAWPAGTVVGRGVVYELPPLGPGEGATLRPHGEYGAPDAATRAAMSRIPFEGHAAFWPLELASVADAPVDSSAWLLVPVPPT